MHSSATPENGAGLAMGLAINGGEGLVMVDTEVVACAGGGGAVRTRRRLSTSSCWWSDPLLREVDPTQRIWNNKARFI